MTTIAYKNGILATDSCWASGDFIESRNVKFIKLKNGIICAGSGANDDRHIINIFSKIKNPRNVPNVKELLEFCHQDTKHLIVYPNKDIWILDIKYSENEKWANFYPIKNDFIAIGSGAHFAVGAMAAGKSAIEAVEIACTLDINSCLPVHYIET